MAIFGQIENDKVLQLCDCVRIDASRTLIATPDTLDSVDKVEIAPDGFNFVEIKASGATVAQKNWFLDWVFESTLILTPEDNSTTGNTNFSQLTSTLDRQTQSYQADVDKNISYFETHARISGTPSGSLVVDLFSGTPDTPGSLLATSSSVDFADLPSDTDTLTRFEFSSTPAVTAGSDYFFALRIDVTDSLGVIQTYYPATDTYANGSRWVSSDGGTLYTQQINDLSFRVGAEIEATDGVVNPTVRITATDGRVVTKSTSLCLMTSEEDKLFSCDADLKLHEQDILKVIPEGYCNWNHMHRRAQVVILEWLDDNGYCLKDGSKVTKANILVKEELREWSTYKTLELIFESQSNSLDDIFRNKAQYYEGLAGRARHAYHRGIDWNQSGAIEKGEERTYDISSVRMRRTW